MRGVLTPLDDYLKRAGRDVDREFTPGIARMVRIDGRVYGLTVTTNASFIVFNKSAFREAGLDPNTPPRTPTEVDRAAKACTKYDANGNLVRYGFRPENLDVWAYVFGGDWYDARTRRVTANDPHNIAALRWMAGYNRMFDLRKIQAFQSAFGDNDSANGPFFIGKLAMWHTGEWSEEFIRRYAPGLEWGWFPLPAPPNGRTNVTPARGSIFVIPAACKHKDAAWEFLNWITSVHAVKTFCAAIHNVPPLIEAGKDPAFQSDPLMRFATQLSQGQNSFGAPPIPIWATYKREIQRAEDRAVLGGEDPQHLLDDLQLRMERELSRTFDDLRE
jgi:multiple sugar transport system substrate-binding protein